MRIPKSVLYGLTASLLLFSVSLAIQKTAFSRPLAADGKPFSSTSRGGSRPVPLAPAYARAGDDESYDPAADDTVRPPAPRGRGPATSTQVARGLGQTVPATSASARGQADFDRRNSAFWSDTSSEVRRSRSVGGGAATSPAGPSTAESPGTSQVKDVFFGTDENTVCQPGGRQFVLNNVDGLYVCVVWQGLAGSYAERLTFVAPDGQVYQTLTVPFVTAGATAPANGIEMEGRRFQVTPAGWGANGEALVIGSLPVAGTFIRQRALVGRWTVKIALNGGPVIDEDTFELLLQ
jgi:hypothetical protein